MGSLTLPCSGQEKKDTKLSDQSKFLLCIGTHVPEIGVFPHTVREHLDGSDAIGLRFLTRGVRTMRRPFAFETAEQPLRHRIVQTCPLVPPAPANPVGRQEVSRGVTGLWTAAVRVVQQPRGGPATSQRHRPRFLPQRRSAMTPHRPTHHLSRLSIQESRHIPPALSRPSRRDCPPPTLDRVSLYQSAAPAR